MRIVLAGSVGSSRRILCGLLRHKAEIAGVLGLDESISDRVSGFASLQAIARAESIPFVPFLQINASGVLRQLSEWSPDVLFVVGLSQLVSPEVLSVPRVGSVGFHPTALPYGRGRAPIAWLILTGGPGAATFFELKAEADSGGILAQEPFEVLDTDYANDVLDRMERAIDRALDRWLPRLLAGEWAPEQQEERHATWFGRRAPADGLIDWKQPASVVHRLVRATSRPHPGAFTFCRGSRLIIWRAEVEPDIRWRGVCGRVLSGDSTRGWLVQTGGGLLRLTEIEFCPPAPGLTPGALKVGVRLGYSSEYEVFRLRSQISALRKRLKELEENLGKPTD